MSVIILLLAASVTVALIFLGAFIWSVKNGQYDDEFSPPYRILFDDGTLSQPQREENVMIPDDSNPSNK